MALYVGSAPLLVEHWWDLTCFDQVLNLIAWLSPVALAGSVLLDAVWCCSVVAIVSEVMRLGLVFVDCPFVRSGHDVS